MSIKITKENFHESRAALYDLVKTHNCNVDEYEDIEVVIQHLLRTRKFVSVDDNQSGIRFFFNSVKRLHFDDKKFWAIRTIKSDRFIDTEVIKYKEIIERF